MPSMAEQEVMACGFTEKEVRDVQRRQKGGPLTDADALLSAVLQSEVELEEELRRLNGEDNTAELQEALRKLAETDAEIAAAEGKVKAVEGEAKGKFGVDPTALRTAAEEAQESSDEEDESEERLARILRETDAAEAAEAAAAQAEDEDLETLETEGFKASPAASPAESPERPSAAATRRNKKKEMAAAPASSSASGGSPQQPKTKKLDRDQVEAAGFDMSEVEKLCAMLGMDDGKAKSVAEEVTAANAKEAKAATQTELEPEAELPPSLVAGDRVEIGGLQGAAQHNGKEGIVTGWLKVKRRYTVEVSDFPSILTLLHPGLLQFYSTLLHVDSISPLIVSLRGSRNRLRCGRRTFSCAWGRHR